MRNKNNPRSEENPLPTSPLAGGGASIPSLDKGRARVGLSLPKLRFPEFLGAGEWEVKKLGQLGEIIAGLTYSPSDVRDNGLLVLRSSNIKDNSILLDDCVYVLPTIKGANLSKANDILICVRNGSTSLIGKNAILPENMPLCTHGAFMSIFRTKYSKFIYQLFQTSIYQNQVSADLGATINSINSNQLIKYKFPIPILSEQQKIADCLSTLDDRIEAENQKLAQLKTHKKALMQQLFPAEGETVPRLRFSEFLGAGEWELNNLLNLSEITLSNGVFNDPKRVGSGYKIINVSDMYIDGAIKESNLTLIEISKQEFIKNKVECGDIFFTRSSLVKSGIAASNIYTGNSVDITYDGHLIRFRPNKKKYFPLFLNALFRTTSVREQLIAKGKTATMTTIGQADVASVKLSIPTLPEQQKISDCLSSLDELINLQTQKIATLKTHKKGMMQQLFPQNTNEGTV